jgi:hypothetical protein
MNAVTSGGPLHTQRPRVCHDLPAAPREGFLHDAAIAEIEAWYAQLNGGAPRVFLCEGDPGTGKTACVAEFVRRLSQRYRHAGLFVWSFEQDPSEDRFLLEAFAYLSGTAASSVADAWNGICRILEQSTPHLLVLDALDSARSRANQPGVLPLVVAATRRQGAPRIIATLREPKPSLEKFGSRSIKRRFSPIESPAQEATAPAVAAERILILYSGTDRPRATELNGKLHQAGYASFVAPDDLSPGEEWPKRMAKEIDRADVALVLVGPEPGAWWEREVYALQERSRRHPSCQIIPVLLPGATQDAAYWLKLGPNHPIDLTTGWSVAKVIEALGRRRRQ